jgi:phosphoribosylanthranilate isomerase
MLKPQSVTTSNIKRTRVKMCGMTRAVDIEHAINLGVDALGFIFYEKSSRYVSMAQAKELLKNLPPFVDAVAVLVSAETEFVTRLINELPIKLVQFHGDERAEFCEQFNTPYIKAIHPHTAEYILNSMEEFRSAQALLLDTPSNTMRGGSGLAFDWEVIPKSLSKPFILAGGLNEFNVQKAIELCSPYAVDVCSGIEALPGIKDHMKMSRFMAAIWDVHNE